MPYFWWLPTTSKVSEHFFATEYISQKFYSYHLVNSTLHLTLNARCCLQGDKNRIFGRCTLSKKLFWNFTGSRKVLILVIILCLYFVTKNGHERSSIQVLSNFIKYILTKFSKLSFWKWSQSQVRCPQNKNHMLGFKRL